MNRHRIARLAVCMALLLLASCASNPPVIVAGNVAQYGTTLMTAVKATQQAVIDAEKAGAIPTAEARKSMVVFQRIGESGQKAAALLTTLADMPTGTDRKQVVVQIQAALDAVDTDLFSALVPIGSAEQREKIGALATEISKTISIINRQILGGVQ